MNPNDDQAVVVAWHVESGSWIDADASVATMETTKSAFEVEAPTAGFVTYSAAPKTTVDVGSVVAWIHEELPAPGVAPRADGALGTKPVATASARAAGSTADVANAEAAAAGRFTRKALRRMQELGLKPEDFAGDGRVEVEEVERRALAIAGERAPSVPGTSDALASNTRGGADTAKLRADGRRFAAEAVALEQSASKIIEAGMLAETYRNVVPSMVTVSCDAALVEKRLQGLAASCTVSLLELVIHEAARELQDFSELNGVFADGRAYAYQAVNVGFALNAGRSLKVPVVRDAGARSLVEIAQSVRNLTLRYMRNELSVDDLVGGTFTITDLSMYGAVHFGPVLGPLQSAILGLCAERPALRQRDLVLVFDHRMSDGMRAAAFLSGLRKRLEG
jgi:pyruvate/2-oxoglutarate dehydrogenase complex dihydrolipoamide acyltransferase (E2) component